MLTNPPRLWPTSMGAPTMPAWFATVMTSRAQSSRGYSSRRPLSPCPLRSGATTWYCEASCGARKLHHSACAAPPWTSTMPGFAGSPQPT